jgi:Ca2+-binding EF-hand superfamily protein
MMQKPALIAAVLLAAWNLSSTAAEGPPGAAYRADTPAASAPARAAVRERCQGDPGQCRAEMQARMAQRFSNADTDRNGALSRVEAERAMPELARRFDALDANRDGQITMEEFRAARIAQRRAQCQANPEQCFREMQARTAVRFENADSDGNGALSRAEAENGMPGLARRFDRLDTNRDGHVTMDEIMTARQARAARQANPT